VEFQSASVDSITCFPCDLLGSLPVTDSYFYHVPFPRQIIVCHFASWLLFNVVLILNLHKYKNLQELKKCFDALKTIHKFMHSMRAKVTKAGCLIN